MLEYIYRYISFETFVGMIQSKALTFVLPELWEDPQESKPFYQFLESKEKTIERMLLIACFQKTYGQCWTKLSESDAMWRIYSYNNKAIRIKAEIEKIALLKNVHIAPVNYTNSVFEPHNDSLDFLASITQKRTAFEHEKEIRLIDCYKFESDEDFFRHVKAFLGVSKHEQWQQAMDNLFPNLTIEEQVEKACQLLNIGKSKQTSKKISFAHVPDFICGVMVHPQSPDWYVKIVEDFCNINNIPFEGQSTLYKK